MKTYFSTTLLLALSLILSFDTINAQSYPPVPSGPPGPPPPPPPPPPPGPTNNTRLTNCSYEAMTCHNGGYIDSDNCQYFVECPTDAPGTKNADMDWWTQHNCTCPDGYQGVDCYYTKPPNGSTNHCPSDHHIWDYSFLNVNQPYKRIECIVDWSIEMYTYSFRLNKAYIETWLDTTGHGTVLFNLMSRHRDPNNNNASDPNEYMCYPQQTDILCYGTDCYAETYNDEAHYSCNDITCHTCAETSTYCTPFLKPIIKATPPVSMIFTNMDKTTGTGHVEVQTTVVSFDLHCQTGVCVNSPIDNNVQSDPMAAKKWITITLLAGGAGLLFIIIILAIWFNRRGKVSKNEEAAAGLQLDRLLAEYSADLPVFGLLFDEVTYTVDIRKRICGPMKQRKILKGVSGMVKPGQLVAILGSSGAGKSSFMDILADRNKSGKIGGFVGLYSSSARARSRADVVSYVLQDDCLLSTQTVRESLSFSARMRLPPSFTEAMIKLKVDRLLKELRIDHIADSKIGSSDEGGGISGGERKRVAIGVELIADPRLLLLDEPTSGLDSLSAHVVMEVLRKTADRGCACILSIHQPPSKVFSMFDQILLLNRQGEQAFMGSPKDALTHMQSIGYAVEDQWINPAEFLLDIAAQTSVEELSRLPRQYFVSPIFEQIRSDMTLIYGQTSAYIGTPAAGGVASHPSVAVHRIGEGKSDHDSSYNYSHVSTSEQPLSYQALPEIPMEAPFFAKAPIFQRKYPNVIMKFLHLTARSFRHISRDPSLLLLQLLVTCSVAAVIGAIFWQLDNHLTGVWNRTGVLFFMILYFSMISLSSLGVLVAERTLFMRERAAQFYDTGPYFFSKLVSDLLPLRVLPSVLFGAICYHMIGLNNDPLKFAWLIIILVLVNMVATGACFAISAATKNVGQANLIASLYFIFSMLFGGLLLNNGTKSSAMVKLQWLSFFHYGFEAIMVNEFVGLQWIFDPAGEFSPTKTNGDVWLGNFALSQDMFYEDMYILLAIFSGFVSFAYICLHFTRYQK